MRQPVKTVLTYGRFDRWNQGHANFLRALAQMGQEVIVGCATDAHAAAQGFPCEMTFSDRRSLLERCRYVSQVIPETSARQKRTDIVNYNVCLLVMGAEHLGEMDDLQDIAKVRYLPRFSDHYPHASSTAALLQAAAG